MAVKDGSDAKAREEPWWAWGLMVLWGLACWTTTVALLASQYVPAGVADRQGWVVTAVLFCTGWTLACALFAFGLGWLTDKLIGRDGTSFFGWVAVIVSGLAAYELRDQRSGLALRLIPGSILIAGLAFAVPLLLVLWATGRLRPRPR